MTAVEGPTVPTRVVLVGALVIAGATALLMVLTSPALAIVWDEGYTLGRQERIRLWFQALRDPGEFASRWEPPFEDLAPPSTYPPRRGRIDTRDELFLPEVLAWFWPFARAEPDGHPPFYALLGLVGDVLAPGWEPLERARLGPMLLFAAAGGALFAFAAKRWGVGPAFTASAAWALQPHLFALAHYATYDGVLTSLWVLAILAFSRAIRDGHASIRGIRWGSVVLLGLILGGALGTKLTGWFLPLPFALWGMAYRSRAGWVVLLIGVLFALSTLLAMMPPWWRDPIGGLIGFFRSNLTRGQTTPLPVMFLGRVYSTPDGSLPWYNTLVWTVLVTPIGFLLLAALGVGRGGMRWSREPIGGLIVLHWLVLMVLRALPHTPGHDGVRQFLPAFGVLALLVGMGAAQVAGRLGRGARRLPALAVVEGGMSVALMMPVPLSYYSPAVGGLPGAAHLGMEPTYYWDALTDDALVWLNTRTRPDQKVRFQRYPTSWLYLRRMGRLRAKILVTEPGEWAWYVVQNRPGGFQDLERALIARDEPAYVVKRWGVPLLWVFPYRQVEDFLRSVNPDPETPR